MLRLMKAPEPDTLSPRERVVDSWGTVVCSPLTMVGYHISVSLSSGKRENVSGLTRRTRYALEYQFP